MMLKWFFELQMQALGGYYWNVNLFSIGISCLPMFILRHRYGFVEMFMVVSFIASLLLGSKNYFFTFFLFLFMVFARL